VSPNADMGGLVEQGPQAEMGPEISSPSGIVGPVWTGSSRCFIELDGELDLDRYRLASPLGSSQALGSSPVPAGVAT
jgi:hypothetical protein